MEYISRVILVIAGFCAVAAHAQKVVTVRQIDFDNFTYAWEEVPLDVPMNWTNSVPNEHFRMMNGMHHFHSPEQDGCERQYSPLIRVDSVKYGDLDGDGIEEAVVALNYSTGGTANWDYIYVYKLLPSGRLKLLARMRTGSGAYGGLIRAFVRKNLLIVDFSDPDKRVGECCSEGYIRVSYRWQDGTFVEEGGREYGKVDLYESPPRPMFRDYQVKHIYRSKPAAPIITKELRTFRTRIREGAKSNVEFAGHYTIPRWGCGTDCNGFMVVDSISGKVYEGLVVHSLPFNWLKERGGDDAIPRMEFYPNSRLLEISACPNEENCGFYAYEMIDGKGLKLLRRELLPKEPESSQQP